MARSKIEWTDVAWNPTRGCTRISEGCRNCYAERQAIRQAGAGGRYEGLVRSTPLGPVWTGKVALDEARLLEPARWRGPLRVFVDSMSDLFHDQIPDAFIDRVFAAMALAPQITFQVLTKRAERMRDYLSVRLRHERVQDATRDVFGVEPWPGAFDVDAWPLPNVWLGVSVENQAAFDERVACLRVTPAAVRFLSVEPLLEAVDVSRALQPTTRHHLQGDIKGLLKHRSFDGLTNELGMRLTPAQAEVQLRVELGMGKKFIPVGSGCHEFDPKTGCPGHRQPRLDWVIVGGESGPRARPCDVAWIRAIVEQCRTAAVPVFVKQVGYRPRADQDELDRWPSRSRAQFVDRRTGDDYEGLCLRSIKGGDPLEWPESLRVREFPGMEVAP